MGNVGDQEEEYLAMSKQKKMNRRRFVKRTVAASLGSVAFPYIIPSSVLGQTKGVAPSNKIAVGCVGVRNQGTSDMRSFLEQEDAHVVAVCDVDRRNYRRAKGIVDRRYGDTGCATYDDFRELLARDDIDAIQITTPDHWHALIAIAAAKAGKDMYGEKPFAHSIREGRAACDAIERYGRVWQTGSQMRSDAAPPFACELVLNGRIGKVHTVEVGLPGGFGQFEIFNGLQGTEVAEIPPEFNYDMWLGPAPYADYVPARTHWNWRWNLEYGGGLLMDWVGHLVDVAHWGIGMDRTGPVEIEGVGEYLKDGIYNSAPKYRIETKYANGVNLVIAGGHNDIEGGIKWIGDEGWVTTWDNTDAYPKSLLKEKFGPNEISLRPESTLGGESRRGHTGNFLDCVKSRNTTVAPSEVGHRSASAGHLAQISMLLDRKLYWNPDTEEFIGDEGASRMLGNALRSPWYI